MVRPITSGWQQRVLHAVAPIYLLHFTDILLSQGPLCWESKGGWGAEVGSISSSSCTWC